MDIKGFCFIRVNCEVENTKTIIAVREADLKRVTDLLIEYNDKYNEKELDCCFNDYLDKHNIEYVDVEKLVVTTVEM